MKTHQIRQAFLDFFALKKHTVVPSSPLVPLNDKTLLFTNAGMVQFKDYFLGTQLPPYQTAASSQCCLRAGGKHNDLENVGFTARHHTFFEMLGNFSFGQYFKKQAIVYAWEFLTDVLKIPSEKLWITVYKDDAEAEQIWLKDMKVSPERFSRCDEDNFWAMGETGPCGPCTEIFYDHGPEIPGEPPGCDQQGDRYVEIWNLVFMQYNRTLEGGLTPLPTPAVDTGMGLERISAVLQGVHDNYEIDLFQELILAAAQLLGVADRKDNALRVISDHLRASAFLVAEGVLPSNEGRGYVLRRIMRRAIRHGQKLNAKGPFFHKLVADLVCVMGKAYPVLPRQQNTIEAVFLKEEQLFQETLSRGLTLLEQSLENTTGCVLSGEMAFKLHDTYGFPLDLTESILKEKNKTVDHAGFKKAMALQKKRAKKASDFQLNFSQLPNLKEKTEFTGYDTLEETGLVLRLLGQDNQLVTSLSPNETGVVILDKTPFYAESGGQIGDSGQLVFEGGCFEVTDTQKHQNAILHQGKMLVGILKTGQQVSAKVDRVLRQQTVQNHSATHLLHAVLRRQFGASVVQKGSLVAPDRLRFDFAYSKPFEASEICAIEDEVNALIQQNTEATIKILPIAEALELGAVALFGEKYGKQVRVLSMAEGFSVELCGGTHVKRTGDIGLFHIISQQSIASGVRRLEALTGQPAIDYIRKEKEIYEQKLALQKEKLKTQAKKIAQLQADCTKGQAAGQIESVLCGARKIEGVNVISAKLTEGDPKMLKAFCDTLKSKLGANSVVVLGVANELKANLIASVTPDLSDKIPAQKLVQELAVCIGGKGGGRAQMAQAGGNQPQRLPEALDLVWDWVKNRLT